MANINDQNPLSKDSNMSDLLDKDNAQQPEPMLVTDDNGLLGILHVHIHYARDIHNICIYHKQDVYAKICLTSDPELCVSTKTINGGGRNPVFDANLQLNVRTVDCSLKCEVWMQSRIKNYLEDQLLGFALIPLPKIIAENAGFTGELSLSSTDLFHSPAGFIELSVSYVGSSPEVFAVPAPVAPDIAGNNFPEMDKIEFPDLNVVKENQLMVSEIFGIPQDSVESPYSESLITDEDDQCPDSNAGVHILESFSAGSMSAVRSLKADSSTSSISVTGSLGTALDSTATPQSLPNPCVLTEANAMKDKVSETADGEVESSTSQTSGAFASPFIHINVEPEQMVVKQDIVDMYMKSMQQFTESLAKLKLPLQSGTNDLEIGNSVSEQRTPTSKGSGPRVFYGSRAFF